VLTSEIGPAFLQSRTNFGATKSLDGRIFVVGGDLIETVTTELNSRTSWVRTNSVEVLFPGANGFVGSSPLNKARTWRPLVIAEGSHILVVGGCCEGTQFTSEVFSTESEAWTILQTFSTKHRNNYTATNLGNGKVLVVGGQNGGWDSIPTIIDPQTREIFDTEPLNFVVTGSVLLPPDCCSRDRVLHTATLLDDSSVLITGGSVSGGNGSTARVERYFPTADDWVIATEMSLARQAHSATLIPNGKIFVVGGRRDKSRGQASLGSTAFYDPVSDIWTDGPNLNFPRHSHAAILLANGKLAVIGGCRTDLCNKASDLISAIEIWDPESNRWSVDADLIYPRAMPVVLDFAPNQFIVIGDRGTDWQADFGLETFSTTEILTVNN